MKRYLPNLLTLLRILVIPGVVFAFYVKPPFSYHLAAALFVFASVTDYFDGMLARAWSVQSSLGRFLDPIADKLLIATALVMLVHFKRADVLPALLIICREMLVSGLREFLAELRISVPVSTLAKYKTAVQMIAITLLLIGPGIPRSWAVYGYNVAYIGDVMLWVAAFLTLVTGYAYLRTGLRHMDS